VNDRYRAPTPGVVEHAAVLRQIEVPQVAASGPEGASVLLREYPWAVVLTQECDLQFDRLARQGEPLRAGGTPVKKHNLLNIVLLCPAFALEHVLAGTYIEEAKKWGGDEAKILKKNRDDRYHLLPAEEPLVSAPIVLDFKVITAAHSDYLQAWVNTYPERVVAVLKSPFRERLTQRFVNYFGRIAEPEEDG
jgi:hypothetical protein